MSHVAYKFKWSVAKNIIQAHIMSLHTLLTPGVGLKRHFFYFTEGSNVAYEIKENGR